MGDIKISLDDSQLSTLSEVLKRPSEHFWRSDNLLKLAQILTLVIGGGWVLTQFVLFQRDEIQLKLQELTHSVRIKELELELTKIKRDRDTHELASMMSSHPEVRFSGSKNGASH